MNVDQVDRTLTFTIPVSPATKKNHQEIHRDPKTGRTWIAQSERYRAYERDCLRAIAGQYRKRIGYPVNVRAAFYMPCARRVDITNLLGALHDVLVKAGVLADDSSLSERIVVGVDGSRVFVDRENPRTEVEITEVT